MADEWERRFDRRIEELKDLLMELAAQRGISIAPRTGPVQSSEGNSGGEPDRTILVKIHSMEYRISCEVLELVFSRFGTLEDAEILSAETGFHSRIRFTDRESAIDAFKALNGRNIYDGCCQMELFLDVLNNKKLSEIEAPMAYASSGLNQVEPPIEDATRFILGSQSDNQVNERTLFVKIHGEDFPISCRELDLVFSRCGVLEKLEKFSTGNEFHSMICFQNKESALEAFNSFNGRDIYDGCCRMELFLMSNLGKEQGIPTETDPSCEVPMNESCMKNVEKDDQRLSRYEESIVLEMGNGPNIGTEPSDLVARQVFEEISASKICPEPELSVEMGIVSQCELNLKVPATMMNREQDTLKVNSVEFLAKSGACNMFDDMPTREFITLDSSVQLNNVHARENWNFDPGGTENLNFVALADNLGFEKPDLAPILIADSVSPKELLVIAQELFGALSKKEIVWVETLLNLHAEFSVDLPSFGSIDSSSSFIFDPGGCFRKVLFGSSKNVDKKVLVQWFTQLSYAFGCSTCDKFSKKLSWGKVQLSNGNEGRSKCNMGDEVFLMPSDSFVYGLTLHYSGEAATLEDGCANTRFLWDPGDHWLLLSTHCCWVLGGLIYVFDPGGEFLNFVLGSVNLCCFPFDPGGIGCP